MRRQLLLTLGLLFAGGSVGWSLLHSQEAIPPLSTAADASAVVSDTGDERPLDTLDWLVGDWVDDKEDADIEFSCHFTKNGAFLLRSFRTLNASELQLSGMQLVAWDAARENLRSWTYDSQGGFGEESWTQSGNRYTLRSKYTLPDGGTGSHLQVVTFIDNDRFTWKSVNREIDGEFLPDSNEIVLVRRPSVDDVKGEK